jgi:hypothetical protein
MKLFFAILIDLFDFTIGRFLFVVPFSGEIIGVFFCFLMFGPRALLYALEAFDPTEQIDGFIPTATLIALAHQREQAA